MVGMNRIHSNMVSKGLLSLLFMAALLHQSGNGASAQEIGSFFVNANYSLGDYYLHNNFTTHKVGDMGVSAGFILPVVVRTWGIHYKGAVAFHDVEDIEYGSDPSPDDEVYYRNLDQYVSSLNEFMVGRRFALGEDFYLHPMIGFGVLVHFIYGNDGEGLAYGSLQFDLMTQAMYRFEKFDLGVQFSFGYVPVDTYLESADVKYITLGAVIAR
jgi:hypothetical protein